MMAASGGTVAAGNDWRLVSGGLRGRDEEEQPLRA